MRRCTCASIVAASLLLAPSAGYAQEPDRRVAVAATFSSSPMRRDVSIIAAAGQAAHRLAELGLVRFVPVLDDRGAKGIAARAAQLYLVSLPLASITGVLSHEYGHVDYVRRAGGQWTVSVEPLPWPFPMSGGLTQGTFDPAQLDALGLISGGSEGAFVLQELIADRIYAQRAAGYFDSLQFIYAKLDTVVYSLTDLSAPDLWSPNGFLQEPAGDPGRFVFEYERQHAESRSLPFDEAGLDARAGSIRTRALTNLADLTLISSFANAFRYLASGDPVREPFAIPVGSLRVAPGLHFMFTPAGFEHRGYVRVMAGSASGTVYLRSITSPIADDLRGGGGAWSWPLNDRTRGRVRLDAWRTSADGFGYLAEAGGERTFAGRRIPFSLGGGLGYKTSGVLEGFRPGSGIVVHIGGSFRF